MIIKTHASSSAGNLYTIEDQGQVLLLEAGITYKKIQQALDFKIPVGCIVSHSHKDHSKEIGCVSGVCTVYASIETFGDNQVASNNKRVIEPLKRFVVGDYEVIPFETQHDCPGSLGFFIKTPSGKNVLFATDTYYIRYNFENVNVFMVECNYDKETLQDTIGKGKLPKVVAKRIMKSHFEFKNVLKFFEANDLSQADAIMLLHASKNNARPEYYREQIELSTLVPTYVATEGLVIEIM